MIPFANDTVTLFHVIDAGIVGQVIHGCSYRRTGRRMHQDSAAADANEVTCRIPAGSIAPAPGDVICLGAVKDAAATAIELTRLLERHRADGAFRVQSVADNARPGMPCPHYAARGA